MSKENEGKKANGEKPRQSSGGDPNSNGVGSRPGETFSYRKKELSEEEKKEAALRAVSDVSRPLPNNIDAEKGVLSALIQAPDNWIALAIETLKSEMFYQPAHQTLYEVIINLPDSGKPIDPVTLQEALIKKNLIDKVGGPTAVADLLTFIPDASHFPYYRDFVVEKATLRSIISACTHGIREAYDSEDEPSVILDTVEQMMMEVRQSAKQDKTNMTIKELVMRAVERVEAMYQNAAKVAGVSWGFRDLDKMTTGMHPGQMLILAGRPGMGKTSLAMNIVESVVLDQGLAALVFSLEMSTDELVQRMLFSRAKINVEKLRDGTPDKKDFPKLMNAADELGKTKLFIDDTPGIGILELRSKARRLASQHDLKLIVVDYLQLVRCEMRSRQASREQEVGEISRGLKGLAKELRLPIIVLAQLNRNPEQRQGGQPRLSDLRESGSIEQDADLVGLIMRAEQYADNDESREEKMGEAKLIIAKQRSGPTGEVSLVFIHSQTRFADAAKEH